MDKEQIEEALIDIFRRVGELHLQINIEKSMTGDEKMRLLYRDIDNVYSFALQAIENFRRNG